MIRCSWSINPVLDRMLEPAPHQVPSKEDEGGNKEAASGGISISAKEDNQGEESDLLSLRGRKRTACEYPETEASKREKKSPLEGPALEGAFAAQSPRGVCPLTSCK